MSLLMALADTDVVSFAIKGHPTGQGYLTALKGREIAISVVTLAELDYGMEIRSWGSLRRQMAHQFISCLTPIPVDVEIAREWARIRALCQRKGRTIAVNDAWIAATARHLRLPLATHNKKDFEIVDGLELLRPPE